MSFIETPRKTTTIGRKQALDALLAAMGPLPREQASALLSLIWIETGGGNLNNFNPGNLTAGPKYSGKIWRPTWFAVTPASKQRDRDLNAAMQAGTAPSAFRAYDTLEAGMRDWGNALRHTFPEVMSAAAHGTPDQFREALSQKYSHDYRNKQSTATFERLKKDFAPTVAHLPKGGGHGRMVAGFFLVVGAAYAGWKFLKGRR